MWEVFFLQAFHLIGLSKIAIAIIFTRIYVHQGRKNYILIQKMDNHNKTILIGYKKSGIFNYDQ